MNENLKKAILLAPKVQAISDDVSQEHIQREDIIKATWLAIVSGRPAFFLGKPGVDKTGTIKALSRCISGMTFYDELMPLLTTGADLIVESTALSEQASPDGGKTISTKDTLGRAATADLFFADEVWKTPDPVLKTLFDLFNLDDLRHEGKRVKNPLLTFLAASNELPEPESQLEALWSRMTIRVQVNSLDRYGKKQLVSARLKRYRAEKPETMGETLTLEEVKLLQAARPFVKISDDVVETVLKFIEDLLDEASADFQWIWDDDRRFGRLFDVMQANALLNGRTTVTKKDMAVLAWMLWDEPEQIAIISAKLAPYTRTILDEAQEVVDTLMAPEGLVDKVLNGDRSKAVQAMTQTQAAQEELQKLLTKSRDEDSTHVVGIEKLLSEVTSTIEKILNVSMGRG